MTTIKSFQHRGQANRISINPNRQGITKLYYERSLIENYSWRPLHLGESLGEGKETKIMTIQGMT